MFQHLTNEMIAVAGVFFVCMIGLAYHTIVVNKMIRDAKAKRTAVPTANK
jgi:hypothetical protein